MAIKSVTFLVLLWQVSLLTARLQEIKQTQGELVDVETLLEQLAAKASSSTRLADGHAQRISQLEQLVSVSGTAICVTDGAGCMMSSEVIEFACMVTITSTSLGHRYTYDQVVSPDFQ